MGNELYNINLGICESYEMEINNVGSSCGEKEEGVVCNEASTH